MYERLIPEVISTFADAGEDERCFLTRLRAADIQLRSQYARSGLVSSTFYGQPLLRAAYLMRYLGHYALQLGDLLKALEGTAAGTVLAGPSLQLAALCGGPVPEAIALATLHQQAGGREFRAAVLDRHAEAWADCWPITARIIADYPGHPHALISGISVNVFNAELGPAERQVLATAQVFTCMNCLNELVGAGAGALSSGLGKRLNALAPGTLVLASDQATYPDCARGLRMLRYLLEQAGAHILLADLDPAHPHEAENRFELPERIAWIYSSANENRFRIKVKQLRLAALIR